MELAQLTCFSSRSPTGPYLAIVNQPNDGDQRTFQKPVTVRCENASALPTRDIVCFAQLFLCGQSRKDATVDSDSSLAYFSPPLEIASSLGGVASIPVSANHPICEFSDLKVHMTTSQMRKRCKFGLRRARESTRTHARARARISRKVGFPLSTLAAAEMLTPNYPIANLIGNLSVRCGNGGCKWVGKSSQYSVHLGNECGFVEVCARG